MGTLVNNRHWLAGLLVALVLVGCSSAEERAAKYLQSGKALYEQGNYEKATLEFKNVLQIDPKHVESRYLLGRIQQTKQNWRAAFANYSRLVELDPTHVDARVRLGNLYLLGNAPEKAMEMAEEALTYEPDNPDAHVLRGSVRARQGDTVAALRDGQTALAADANHAGAILLLSSLYARDKQVDKAVALLDEGIRRQPDNTTLRLLLAKIYVDEQQYAKAVRPFQEVISIEPQNVGHHIRLSAFHIKLGQLDEAENVLRDAIAVNPESDTAKLALVEFLASQRDRSLAERELVGFIQQAPSDYALRFALATLYEAAATLEKAKDVYREIIQLDGKRPQGLKARNALSRLYLTQNNVPAAEAMVAEVLQENPRDSEALLMRGNIALAKPDLPAAIADLRTVLRDQPNSGRALRLLARAHQLNSEPELAKETLQRAVKASPRDIQTRLELAQSFAQGANLDSALEELQAVLDVSPVHLGALQAQIRIQMAKGDWRAAERIAQHIRSTYPDRPLGYHLMGLVYQAERKLDASIGEFELALERAPDAVEPLSALIGSYLADKKPHKALARLDQVIEQTPTNSVAYDLKGQALLIQKNRARAEAAFRTASQLNPKWALPYWHLGVLHLAQGNNEKAIRVLQEGLKATSGNAALSLQLATEYERSGKHEQAIREYENLLARSPRSEPAANNLAMLLADYRQDGKSRDKALELARRFEASKNPLYVDTLGWVYYKHGRLDEGISLLSSAVANAPDHPILNYHLGMAYYAQGQMASARQHLEKAVAAKQPFPGVDEAKNTLADL